MKQGPPLGIRERFQRKLRINLGGEEIYTKEAFELCPAGNSKSSPPTGENMPPTFSASRSRTLRWMWPLAIALLLLAGLTGCGGASRTAIPPATEPPVQATSPTQALPTQTPADEPRPDGTTFLRATMPSAPTPATPPVTAPPQPTPAEELQSDKERTNSPRATAHDLRSLVRGNNAFALDLYQVLSNGEGNLFYSPFSISQALAMTLAGARGETERQMLDTLHYELSQDRLHPSFNSLDRELASRGRSLQGEEGQYFQLNVANAIWGQQGYEFLPGFLDVLAENYGAGLRTLDFAGAPEEARVRINDWVSGETEEKIKDLLPPGAVDRLTRLVLTNAIYFNASWSWPFDKRLTQERPFYMAEGGRVEAPMMSETSQYFYGYAKGDGYQAVDVPYSLDEMSMIILLPDEGMFHEFEDSLNAEVLDRILGDIEIDYVTLTMPLFKFESQFDLGETLAGMGMPDAFGAGADFSGMTGTRELRISKVVHKAFVSVDERGTEAAAATAVAVPTSGPTKEPIPVTVDRPFIFLIRDTATGTLLFLGRMMNPKH